MTYVRLTLAMMLIFAVANLTVAAPLLQPGDAVLAVDIDPPGSLSSYPGGEPPSNILDATAGTKYLNFARENSGFIVTPAAGSSVVRSFQLTTANDAEARDPATWSLFGTNDAIASVDNSLGNGESWTLIGSGSVALPADRQALGPVVDVPNDANYLSYRMVFPTLKDAPATNSMQVADVQFFENLDGSGAAYLAVGDPILAVDLDIAFNSRYPAGEPPANLIDGSLNKYLNFGRANSGFIVTPSVGPTIVNSFTITTANDAEARDPATWELYGTNDAVISADNSQADGGEDWVLIDSGDLMLPADRNAVGPEVAVDNSTAFTSYWMLFPTVKDAGATNSMQIAEIQFDGTVVPEPSSFALAGMALMGLGWHFWVVRRFR